MEEKRILTRRGLAFQVRDHLNICFFFWADHKPFRRTSRTLSQRITHVSVESQSNSLGFPVLVNNQLVSTAEQSSQDASMDKYNPRQRSQSMGVQCPIQDIGRRPFPPADGVEPNVHLDPASFVVRPPRKSSLATMPPKRHSRPDIPTRPAISRVSSASVLQSPASRTLRPRTSMPEPSKGFFKDSDEGLTPTRRDFQAVQEVTITPSKQKSREDSSCDQPWSHERFSAHSNPVPLPLVPNTHHVVDLSSPLKSQYRTEHININSRPGTASSLAYSKDTPTLEFELDRMYQLTPPPEDERPFTPGSMDSNEDTLSLFPQPPPLNLRHHLVQSPTPSQCPLTPDDTPNATPTSETFSQSPPSRHVRMPSPQTSILKKSPSYYNSLPSPPITPGILLRSSSKGSFQMMSPAPLAPTLQVRNSSPHIASAKMHNVHRPTSSDPRSAYPVSSGRMDYNLGEQRQPEAPSLLEAYQPKTQNEMRPPPSPEPDSQGVQWGYAV